VCHYDSRPDSSKRLQPSNLSVGKDRAKMISPTNIDLE
jgi:hypothetical protein